MNVQLTEGTYVLAISGGVDSMVLLHSVYEQFKQNSRYTFVVAHFDHGIREDSALDAQLVEQTAKAYNFLFYTEEAHLGAGASEQLARTMRYAFLRSVKGKCGAQAIVTAHHQDDLLETILLHVARGTGRNGLTPMRAYADIVRPFLAYSKNDILQYASEHKLSWREDSTNKDTTYKRNHMRSLLSSDKLGVRPKLLAISARMNKINTEADAIVTALIGYVVNEKNECVRSRYVQLSHQVACEVMIVWLQNSAAVEPSKNLINRLVLATKTLESGKKIDISEGWWLYSDKNVVKICKNT